MNKTLKIEAFERHKEMLEWLWFAGKGLMFRQHFERYFLIFGHTRNQIHRAIHELVDAQLIETSQFHRFQVLKIKKFSIYRFADKKPDGVSAIRYSSTALIRSAFVHERILTIVLEHHELQEKNSEALLRFFRNYSTYFVREKQSYIFLEKLHRLEESQFGEGKILSPNALEDIRTMRLIRAYSEHRKDANVEAAVKIRTEKLYASKMEQSVTLNNLIAQNIHLWIRKDSAGYFIQIDILDVNSALNMPKFSRKLEMTYRYLFGIFEPNIRLQCHILCRNKERESKFVEKMPKVARTLCQSNGWNDIDIHVMNLDLDRILFGGRSIIT